MLKPPTPGSIKISVHVMPLSSDSRTLCSDGLVWLSVPLMVCTAVWVMKSLLDAPVSSLSCSWEMADGELLSTTMVLLLTSDRLPATSVAYRT